MPQHFPPSPPPALLRDRRVREIWIEKLNGRLTRWTLSTGCLSLLENIMDFHLERLRLLNSGTLQPTSPFWFIEIRLLHSSLCMCKCSWWHVFVPVCLPFCLMLSWVSAHETRRDAGQGQVCGGYDLELIKQGCKGQDMIGLYYPLFVWHGVWHQSVLGFRGGAVVWWTCERS